MHDVLGKGELAIVLFEVKSLNEVFLYSDKYHKAENQYKKPRWRVINCVNIVTEYSKSTLINIDDWMKNPI